MIAADKVLNEAQLTKLLRRLKAEKDKSLLVIKESHRRNPKEVRVVIDYFLFALLAQTGLRISEALNLRWPDIHEDSAKALSICSSKCSIIFLRSRLIKALLSSVLKRLRKRFPRL